MIRIVVLLGLVLLIAWLLRQIWRMLARSEADGATALPRFGGRVPGLLFLANGKLYRRTEDQPIEEVVSPFLEDIERRQERHQELHAWKQGTAFATAFAARRQIGTGERDLRFAAAVFRDADHLLYFLSDQGAGGLFELNVRTGEERRLLHRQNLSLEGLRLSNDGRELYAARSAPNGVANICVLNLETLEIRDLSTGDTSDRFPCDVPGQPGAVVFQSSGLGRGPEGGFLYGPASLQWIVPGRRELETIIEDPAFDYLQPRVAPNGNLLYLRRPYEGAGYGHGQATLDVLLLPFRLLRALFHYLNFFSLMYTRKPLTSASGQPFNEDAKALIVQGRRLDAEAALKSGRQVLGVPSLVPASWQLFARDPQGGTQVLARHVVAFDVAADGTVLYSNGFAVFAMQPGQAPILVLRDRLIGELAVQPQASAKVPTG
ncbi:hypothetical protein C7S18_14930 [Ahniella affigens]|uniref:SMP-30/Gluconolactonase/LRE-like region domain-containing protein n=1 Tax=Ahniella affigens TaxID=2021234 RepID=A0A2P1PUA9_9GAMM|nr:hypothetical protein [Ahniella affigens]AVP98402.1 hypothetical protein C7S18_14930 [Ahniella affigens]